MCGIIGIVRNIGCRIEQDIVHRSSHILNKRGPDDCAEWTVDNVGLGHRRLSVLDVTQAAHQPMIAVGGHHVVSYNGGIYNYRELRRQIDENPGSGKSNSDTEVLRVAYDRWGPACVSRFHGMFAFAIWAYIYVPKDILDRPKQGFVVPIDRWLRGPLKDWAEERIHDPMLFSKIPLDRPAFLSLWRMHSNKERTTHPLLWSVLNLSEFVRGQGGSQ